MSKSLFKIDDYKLKAMAHQASLLPQRGSWFHHLRDSLFSPMSLSMAVPALLVILVIGSVLKPSTTDTETDLTTLTAVEDLSIDTMMQDIQMLEMEDWL